MQRIFYQFLFYFLGTNDEGKRPYQLAKEQSKQFLFLI